MDKNELFLSCRKGDLVRVRYLVEQKEVDLNIRDKWDSTPLYYACLCGHHDLVQYLLEHGAHCEANTFDGERCLYGALDVQIRSLLKNFKVVTSKTMKHDKYEEFFQRYLETGEYSDVCFVVHGESLPVHRCILSARCEYFREMFTGKWMHRKTIHISNPLVTVKAFKAVLEYLYTGRLEIHFNDIEDCVVLAKQCGLQNLIDEIEEGVRKVRLFECTKPGTHITTLLVESESHSTDLQQDFGALAEQTLPEELCNWVGGNELPFLPNLKQLPFSDLYLSVDGHKFQCHKVFFCGRSDYFRALVADHFGETEQLDVADVQLITLHDIRAEIFVQVLYYIYTNTTKIVPSHVFDVLCAADIYLLPGLKRQCAIVIGQHLDINNVVYMLKLARMYELPRLEDQCTEFMAKFLEQIIGNSEFQSLVQSDAQEVQHRQETDTIDVIDDIRFHITNNVQTFSAMEDANEKLKLIDKLLETLGLDA